MVKSYSILKLELAIKESSGLDEAACCAVSLLTRLVATRSMRS